MPFAKVEVAPVTLSAVVWIPAAKVEVADAFDVMTPVFEILNREVVALAVDEATLKREVAVSPLFACTESLAMGEVVPTPALVEVKQLTEPTSQVVD